MRGCLHRNSTKVIGTSPAIPNLIPNDPRHGHLSYTSTPGCAPAPTGGLCDLHLEACI